MVTKKLWKFYYKIKINHQDNGGYTALIEASQEGHKEIVEMLNTKEKDTKY